MSMPIVITSDLRRVQRGHGKGFTAEAPRGPVHLPARIAVMLAFAHTMRDEIAQSRLPDQAEAARRLGVTPARVSQLLDLLSLAPDIQEHILFLEAVDGRQPMYERQLRPLVRERHWSAQRAAFDQLRRRATAPTHTSMSQDRTP